MSPWLLTATMVAALAQEAPEPEVPTQTEESAPEAEEPAAAESAPIEGSVPTTGPPLEGDGGESAEPETGEDVGAAPEVEVNEPAGETEPAPDGEELDPAPDPEIAPAEGALLAVPAGFESNLPASNEPRPELKTSAGKKVLPLDFYGEIRYIGGGVTDFAVDNEGTTLGQGFVVDQRFRIGLDGTIGSITLGTEWDLFTGQIAGDTWDIPGDIDERDRGQSTVLTWDGFVPRKAAVVWEADVFKLQAGLMTSDWGLGLLSNNGARKPLFGRNEFGDRVIRLIASTQVKNRPGGEGLPLFLAGAFDLVVEDEIAKLADGQQATQGTVSVLYADPAGRKVGLYGVYRNQWERDQDRTTSAWIVDVYGDVPVPIGDSGWRLRFAAEVAAIFGKTDRVLTYNNTDGIAVSSIGMAGIVEANSPNDLASIMVRTGYASADGNPDDGGTHDFAFDRDFDVGMILFDDVMGGVEAATHNLLTDPQYAGQPPDGVDALVTEGAFRRAAFLQPVVVVKPIDLLEIRAGFVSSWSTGPVSQPFYSYRNGGVPMNHHGEVAEGRYLGTEVDWAIGIGQPVKVGKAAFAPLGEIQGGHLVLGDVLSGDGPGVVHRVQGVATLTW